MYTISRTAIYSDLRPFKTFIIYRYESCVGETKKTTSKQTNIRKRIKKEKRRSGLKALARVKSRNICLNTRPRGETLRSVCTGGVCLRDNSTLITTYDPFTINARIFVRCRVMLLRYTYTPHLLYAFLPGK